MHFSTVAVRIDGATYHWSVMDSSVEVKGVTAAVVAARASSGWRLIVVFPRPPPSVHVMDRFCHTLHEIADAVFPRLAPRVTRAVSKA